MSSRITLPEAGEVVLGILAQEEALVFRPEARGQQNQYPQAQTLHIPSSITHLLCDFAPTAAVEVECQNIY